MAPVADKYFIVNAVCVKVYMKQMFKRHGHLKVAIYDMLSKLLKCLQRITYMKLV